jgi:hypothetical protein
MELMMECLLAKIDSNSEEMKTKIGSLASRMDVNQTKTEAGQEMKAAIRSSQEESEAKTEAWLEEKKACRVPTETCIGKTEATIKTGQEQMRAEIRTGLEEMKVTESGSKSRKGRGRSGTSGPTRQGHERDLCQLQNTLTVEKPFEENCIPALTRPLFGLSHT